MYIKVDAQEQLFLLEGVCQQSGIVQYHPATQLKSALKDGEQVSPIPSSPGVIKPDEEGVVEVDRY